MSATLELSVVREILQADTGSLEGFTLGRIYDGGVFAGYTLECPDRFLEKGGVKIHGKTAMPLGRYEVDLYDSPKHGEIVRFFGVPNFDLTEIHGANFASQLEGCVAVGEVRTRTGVASCAPVVQHMASLVRDAKAAGKKCFCTISRHV